MQKKYKISNLYLAILEIKNDKNAFNVLEDYFDEKKTYEYYTVLYKINDKFIDLIRPSADLSNSLNYEIIKYEPFSNYYNHYLFLTKKKILNISFIFYNEFMKKIYFEEISRNNYTGGKSMKNKIKFPFVVENRIFSNERELCSFLQDNLGFSNIQKKCIKDSDREEIEFPYSVSGVDFYTAEELYLFISNRLIKNGELKLTFSNKNLS